MPLAAVSVSANCSDEDVTNRAGLIPPLLWSAYHGRLQVTDWLWESDRSALFEGPLSRGIITQTHANEEIDLDLVFAIHQRLIAEVDPKNLARLNEDQAREA